MAESLARVAHGLQALTGGKGSEQDYVAVEAVPEGFDALYWAFRYLQGREAWSSDGPLDPSTTSRRWGPTSRRALRGPAR